MVNLVSTQFRFRRLVHVASFVLLGLIVFHWVLEAGLIGVAFWKRGYSGVLSELMDSTIRITGEPGVGETTILITQGGRILVALVLAFVFAKTR